MCRVESGDQAGQFGLSGQDDLGGRTWKLGDRLSGQEFDRAGDEIASSGLYVALGPWESYFLSFGG